MSRVMFERAKVAEARKEIPEGTAGLAVFQAIGEAALTASYEGYYGKDFVNKSFEEAIAERKARANTDTHLEQAGMDRLDDIIADISALDRAFKATETTSDFGAALVSMRQRTIRDTYQGPQSAWRSWADVTTTPDFKAIRSLRFEAAPGLKLRPEGTDVQYVKVGVSDEGYKVSNYEAATKYTWEMWVNDEWGRFVRLLQSFGEAAQRIEVEVVFKAILAGVPRTALTASAGEPTITRLSQAVLKMNQRTFSDSEGNTLEYGIAPTDIIFGTADMVFANTALNTQYTDFQGGNPNPVSFLTPHMERLWSSIMGRDYVLYDNTRKWLEVAFLEGFQTGPKTYVKLPTSRDYPDEGNFEDHTLHVKMGHTLGAKVIEPQAALRVEGAA